VSETAGQSELDDLRGSVRDFLSAKSGEEQVRRVMESETGYDEAVWAQMADQLGLQQLVFPEEHGGYGFGFAELSVVLQEMGRALLPSPFLSSVVLAGSALLAADDAAAAAAHLPGIASGKTTATLAVAGESGSWDPTALPVVGTRADDGWRLGGTTWFVLDGATADLLLVAAVTDAGPSLFAVSGTAAGLTRTELRTLDPTRRQARLDLDGVVGTPVGALGGAAPVLDRVLDLAMTALAAEQVGGARACLEASAAYARDRVQFGRPIGTFQAVKHKCADMLVRVQLADAAAQEAADAAAGLPGRAPLAEAAAVAHAVCSESYVFAAAENIQVHGGIGFTWEHPAHLYFRRAKSSQLLFGGPAGYFGRVLDRAGV